MKIRCFKLIKKCTNTQEGDRLKKIKERLDEENKDLRSEKEMNELVIQQKVAQSQQQKQTIKEVKSN